MDIPEEILKAASMAAFPGLPEGISLEEADRRVAAALQAAWPLIELKIRQKPDGPRFEARELPGHLVPTYGIYDTRTDKWMGDHLGWREWMTSYDFYAAEVAEKMSRRAD